MKFDLEGLEGGSAPHGVEASESKLAGGDMMGSAGIDYSKLTYDALYKHMVEGIGPKLRFTTNPEEAEASKNADRSDSLHLPDRVIYVGPKETAAKSPEKVFETSRPDDAVREIPRLERNQNKAERDYDFPKFQRDIRETRENIMALLEKKAEIGGLNADIESKPEPGAYTGPSVEALDRKLDEARKDLENARERLDAAAKSGKLNFTLMNAVDTYQKIVDKYASMREDALSAENG